MLKPQSPHPFYRVPIPSTLPVAPHGHVEEQHQPVPPHCSVPTLSLTTFDLTLCPLDLGAVDLACQRISPGQADIICSTAMAWRPAYAMMLVPLALFYQAAK